MHTTVGHRVRAGCWLAKYCGFLDMVIFSIPEVTPDFSFKWGSLIYKQRWHLEIPIIFFYFLGRSRRPFLARDLPFHDCLFQTATSKDIQIQKTPYSHHFLEKFRWSQYYRRETAYAKCSRGGSATSVGGQGDTPIFAAQEGAGSCLYMTRPRNRELKAAVSPYHSQKIHMGHANQVKTRNLCTPRRYVNF